MLIDFFYTLRAAKLKVSVKEYLTLLEALQAGVIDDDGGPTVDKFYYLARTSLVKDEAQFDKFDRAFAAYFKGVELLTDFTQDVPLEWLRKALELELSPEDKAAIEKMGWDELMDTLKKRFEEQKERHEGGNKHDRHRRHQPVRCLRLQPAGHPHRPGRRGATRAPSRCGTSAPTRTTTTPGSWARATSRWRCAGCAASRARAADLELDLDDTIHSTAANAGLLDIKIVPERTTR
jgi:uncharacterized protein with von Willebrand factor type A (vWA) domain